MTLLFSSKYHPADQWLGAITALMPELETAIWPNVPDPAAVEAALAWAPKKGALKLYPNLKFISSFGAGVEHIMADADLPPQAQVVRIVDDRLTGSMTEYLLLHVLRQHRRLDQLRGFQQRTEWAPRLPADTPHTTIGILGLGHLGSHAAHIFAELGFRVVGWSRSPKRLPGVESFAGAAQLKPFLSRCNYLICLLPLTPETRGILDAGNLAALPPGAYVINAGRGPEVVDDDLLAAIDAGRLSGATLDVFHREPLKPEHRFWHHPKITVTPHNAADSLPEYVAPQIVENIRRARAGEPLLNVVDRDAGY